MASTGCALLVALALVVGLADAMGGVVRTRPPGVYRARPVCKATPQVPFKVPNTEYWQWISIYERMSRERILFLNKPLEDGVVNGVIATLLYLENQDRTSPVQLYVNVPGSLTKSGLALYDTMRTVAFPIATLNVGMAADAGAIICAAGAKGQRLTLPNARFVLASPRIIPSAGRNPPPMQAEDIAREAREVLRDRNRVVATLAELTGQTHDVVRAAIKRDTYYDAQEAVDFGLVDRVIGRKESAGATTAPGMGFAA